MRGLEKRINRNAKKIMERKRGVQVRVKRWKVNVKVMGVVEQPRRSILCPSLYFGHCILFRIFIISYDISLYCVLFFFVYRVCYLQ